MKKLNELVEIVEFNAGGARAYLTIKAIDESASISDAFELADKEYPCAETENWDSFEDDFDEETKEIVLHR